MRTDEAAKGRWALIFAHYDLPPINPHKHYTGPCPVCGGVGKLRVDDKDGEGTWVCVHGAGKGFKLLEEATGKSFAVLAKEVDQLLGNSFRTEVRQPTQSMDKVAQARGRFLSLPPVHGTDAAAYLSARGIYHLPKKGVRYSSGEYDHDEKRTIPALYSIASNEYGEPVYLHLTYIEHGKKAAIETQRKMHKLQDFDGSVAVKLYAVADVIGIAEGIESALSAASIYRMPVWSTLNANIMRKFRSPTGVKVLYIFADNDKNGTGLAAAFECGRANILAKNDVETVFIRWPSKLNDFNDVILSGDEVIEWALSK